MSSALGADIGIFSPPGVNPGWPVIAFDVPANKKLVFTSQRLGITSHFYFLRRKASAASSVKYKGITPDDYWAGEGGTIKALPVDYSYLIGGVYFGDFQTSYGPMQIAKSKWSSNGTVLTVWFSRVISPKLAEVKVTVSIK
jgi:hypothetical protein